MVCSEVKPCWELAEEAEQPGRLTAGTFVVDSVLSPRL